jgi:hypothetical protein
MDVSTEFQEILAGEDAFLYFSALCSQYSLAASAEPLSEYRIHGTNASVAHSASIVESTSAKFVSGIDESMEVIVRMCSDSPYPAVADLARHHSLQLLITRAINGGTRLPVNLHRQALNLIASGFALSPIQDLGILALLVLNDISPSLSGRAYRAAI